MNTITSFFAKEISEAIGWTLFHSIWQAAVIAIILAIVLFFLGKISAQTRYIVAMVSLLFVLICSVVTFSKTYHKAIEKAEIARQIKNNPGLVVENFKKAVLESKQEESKTFFTIKFKIKWILFKSYFHKHFPVILIIWMLGILFFMLRFAGSLIYTNRLKYRQTTAFPSSFTEMVQNLQYKFNIGREIKFFQSFAVKVPLTIGYFKPVVLMPVSLLTGLPADQIENIIAHEIAHIKRHDYLFNILQSVIEILFFYHPAVWWISSVARTEREHSCDDLAVKITGDSLSFAKALTNVQEQILMPEKNLAMAFSGNKNKLFNRVKRILTKPAMKNNLNERLIASCVIFTGLILLMVTTAFSSGNKLNQSTENSFHLTSGFSMINPGDTIKNDQGDTSENKEEASYNEEVNEEMDELYSQLDELNIHGEDFYKNLEIMLENLDDNINGEILAGINGALKEIDINAVVNEALNGAEAALNSMDINAIVRESMKEENQDVEKITHEAIKGARAAIENMDINLIIEEALNAAEGALNAIDFEDIEDLAEIGEDMEEAMKDMEEGLRDLEGDIDDDVKKNYRNESIHKGSYWKNENKNAEKYSSMMKEGAKTWNDWRSQNENSIPDLSDINLSGLNINGINFSELSLSGTELKKTDLRKANFSGCNGNGFYLGESVANETNFELSTLIYSEFYLCSLINSDFRNANLTGTLFNECNLTGADFRSANLRGVKFRGGMLNKANFKGAVANKSTFFPEGFDWKKEGIRME